MDNESIQGSNPLNYNGQGSELAIIMFKNIILTILTLGIYAAWARTNTRRYLWGHTSFLEDRSTYTGQGKELFKGWLFIMGLYLAVLVFVRMATALNPFIPFFLLPLYIYLYSIIIYSGTRYRFSRTKWREVTFGVDKDKAQARAFSLLFVKGIVLSFFTLGFYYPFHLHHTRKFITDRSRFGNLHFLYTGDASTLFWLMFRSMLLMMLTFGIYAPWYFCEMTSYRLNNTQIGNAKIDLRLKGWDLFVYSFASYFLTIVTLGLALPWVINWGHKLVTNAISINGEITLGSVQNVESSGEAFADVAAMEYDIDLGF